MSTQAIPYRRRHNYADASFSTSATQRWPVTPSRARRAAVDDTLAAYSPGSRAYQWVRILDASVPSVPVLSLDPADSSASDVHLTWTSLAEPDSFEVWRSLDGAAFLLLASVPGTTLEYHDTDAMGAGEVWCYKVRAVNAAGESSFSATLCALNAYALPQVGAVLEPTWTLSFGGLAVDNTFGPTSLSLPGLLKASGNLELGGLLNLETMNLPALVSVGGDFFLDSNGTFSGTFTSCSLPSLTTLGGDLNASNCPNLADFSAPLLTYRNGGTYDFRNCALSAASVEGILARALASGVTSATIQLEDGGNAGIASLSTQGQNDYADLLSAGNTVTANP